MFGFGIATTLANFQAGASGNFRSLYDVNMVSLRVSSAPNLGFRLGHKLCED